jgi:hypothetical protein
VVARLQQRSAPAENTTAARRDTDMRFTGLVLMIIGIFSLVIYGINYNRQRTAREVRSFRATATEQRHTPSSPMVGGIVLFGGTLLLTYPRRRLA